MKYSVKKSELEECDEQGMILQLEEEECLVVKIKDLKKELLNIGAEVYQNLHRTLPKYHKINSAQDKILNDINLAIDESISEFSNLLLKKIDTPTDVGENKLNGGNQNG